MGKEIGERIKTLRKVLGLTQEEFGKRIGRTKSAIATYEAGKREPDQTVLLLLEKEFNVNPGWLLEGKGEIFIDRYIPIEFYQDYELSAGNGIATDYSAKLILQVSEDLIKEKLGKVNISKLVAFPVNGNSMSPTIPEGSIGIFVDFMKEHFLLDGEIYAFRIDDTFYVKRVSKNPAGKTITFISDNPDYEPFTLTEEELDEIMIIGRYIGHIKLK